MEFLNPLPRVTASWWVALNQEDFYRECARHHPLGRATSYIPLRA